MVRTEISLFMKNEPGELGKLATFFGEAGINIDAITIQDASSYVQELFKARGKSLKRVASPASSSSLAWLRWTCVWKYRAACEVWLPISRAS